MFSSKKIKRSQLQDGIVDIRQITGVTLDYTSWTLVSGYYTYTYTNSNIVSTSIVDVIPDNSSVAAIKTAGILPNTTSIDGSVTFYSLIAPTENIIVTINIQNTKQITSASDTSEWTRPIDWLTMPTIGAQEFIGLLAITDDESNHIALNCAGAYTVNWGDGVTENVATGVKAQHSYTYSTISSATLSTRGYKQVLVRVTPQVGQNLTTINLQQQNSILSKGHAVGWLDIAINGSNITSLVLGGNTTVYMYWCENVDIYSFGNITIMQQLFFNFYALQKFSLPSNISSVTNLYRMFAGCRTLKKIPLFDTSANTSFQNFCIDCNSLQEAPLFNTANGTDFRSMFENCFSLRTIPLFNTANGTNFSTMLNACYNIQSIPLLDTSKGTNFSYMLQQMYSLQSVPNLNTALGTTFAGVVTLSPSIAKAAFQGTRYAISYSGLCLSKNAIVDIFNGLGTASSAQTITVSSNPGYTGLTTSDLLIATNKGWTIA